MSENDGLPFDIGGGWVEWTENSVPVRLERIQYIQHNRDGSFSARTWVRKQPKEDAR